MSDREQWRFQWPDGTWIRWNPQTQSWEKEDQSGPGGSAPVEPPPREIPQPTPEPEDSTSSRPTGWKPVSGDRAPESSVRSAEPAPDPVVDEPAPDPVVDEPAPEVVVDPSPELDEPAPEPVVTQEVRTGGRRPSARDVLPAQQGPDRPGGSLWPTVIAGAVVGIGVGLLLSAVIQ